MKQDSLDSILRDFDFTEATEETDPEIVLPIRVSLECKAMYDQLQRASKRKFVKTLKRVVTASIEKAYDRGQLTTDQ